MNIGKLQGVDNIPFRYIFLSTGECIIDGVEIKLDEQDEKSKEGKNENDHNSNL